MKVSALVLLGLLATTLLRKQSAAVRHWVLAAALVCAAAAPALPLVAPVWHVSPGAWWSSSGVELIDRPLAVLDPTEQPSAAVPADVSLSESSRTATIVRALGFIWLAGVGASLFVLLVGLSRLAWLASRSERLIAGAWAEIAADISRAYGLRRRAALLQSGHPTLLVTWGFARPKVLLPADAPHWPENRIRIVLAHELAHVRRGDWIVQMAALLLRSAYWFNPLVWIACRRLRLESEHACDDAVLKMGVEGSTYASELVDLARAFRSARPMFLPAAAIAPSSSLERRVRAMLNVRLNRDPITRPATIVAAVLLVAVTVLVAGFGASAQSFSTVSGSIVDPLGRALPGVTLTLSNARIQSKYQIKSDPTGRYEFVGLPPGNYTLVFEQMGFASIKREGIALSGQPLQQNTVMQVGSVQETITVWDGLDGPSNGVVRRTEFGPYSRFPPGQQCVESPVGGNIRPPTKLRDVRPIYPTGAGAAQVVLDARIGADGFVTRAEVVGDADPAFTNAAINAVTQWEFTPTYLDCQPIEVHMKVLVNFVSAK